eukprot:Opistho-2@54957
MGPLKEGFLTKQGGGIKTWKKRWFILKDAGSDGPLRLEYFPNEKAGEALGVINLEEASGIGKVEGPKGQKYAFEVVCPGRTYIIVADSDYDMDDWLALIKGALDKLEAAGKLHVHSLGAVPAAVTSGTGGAAMEGWLMKCGGRIKTWKRRFFTLSGKNLLYYKTSEPSSELLGDIDLRACIGITESESENSFVVATKDRDYQMIADSRNDMDRWLAAIRAAMEDGSIRMSTEGSDDIDDLVKRGQKTLESDSDEGEATQRTTPISIMHHRLNVAPPMDFADTPNAQPPPPLQLAIMENDGIDPATGQKRTAVDEMQLLLTNMEGMLGAGSKPSLGSTVAQPPGGSGASGAAGLAVPPAKATFDRGEGKDRSVSSTSAFDEMEALLKEI